MLTKEKIAQLDKADIFNHIKDLGKQFEVAYERSKDIKIEAFPKFQNIILLGTGGGSSIASKLVKAILDKEINLPIVINQGYSVPKWVNNNTLAVALTVSGNTEETIQAYQQAVTQGAFGVAVTAGGKLKEVVTETKTHLVSIPETAMQARSAIGDLIAGILRLFEKLELLNRDYSNDVLKTVELLKSLSNDYSNSRDSLPVNIAQELKGFSPVIYSSDELPEVASVRWKNQFGENSKVIAHWYTFPELNHDEIVGWEQEENIQKHFKVVFLRDNNDHERIKKRMDITKELIEKRGVKVIEVYSKGDSNLERAMSLIYLGDWVSIYLAFLYDIDPTPVNLIIEMKQKL